MQTKTTKTPGRENDADVLSLVESFIANPDKTTEELWAGQTPVQQALMQRASDKPPHFQLLRAVRNLPTDKQLELVRAAKTSPQIAKVIGSFSKRTHLDLIEMAKTDSMEAVMDAVLQSKSNKDVAIKDLDPGRGIPDPVPASPPVLGNPNHEGAPPVLGISNHDGHTWRL